VLNPSLQFKSVLSIKAHEQQKNSAEFDFSCKGLIRTTPEVEHDDWEPASNSSLTNNPTSSLMATYGN